MKKHIFSIFTCATISIVFIYITTTNKVSYKNVSNLSLINIEALANSETTDGYKRKVEEESEEVHCVHLYDGTYLVTTEIWKTVECEGEGKIECTPQWDLKSSNTEISYECQCFI